jgi:general secretion pathway protein B
MSLILDALNRSESERATPDAVPGLQSVHGAPTSTAPQWKRWLWPGLVMLLLAVALLFQFGSREPAQPGAQPAVNAVPAAAVSSPPSVTPVEPTSAPPVRPVAEPAPATTAEPAVNPDVAALYQTPPGNDAQADPDPDPAPAEPSPVASVQTQDIPAASVADQPALDVVALAKAAEVALAERSASDAPVVEHEAPYLSELRQSQKDQIPSVFYSAHSWASNPSERRVVLNVLNGQERRAGQQVKPGLRLVEILEDSIVLDFRGTEFRLRSLNSWVNL